MLLVLGLFCSALIGACGSGGSEPLAPASSAPAEELSPDAFVVRVLGMTNNANEAAAIIEVRVNDVTLSPNRVVMDPDSISGEYAFSTAEPVAPGAKVEVVVLNGGADAAHGASVETRMVALESVVVNGYPLLPEEGVFDAGQGEAAFDSIDLTTGSSEISQSGALRLYAGYAIAAATTLREPSDADPDSLLADSGESPVEGKANATRWCTGLPNQNLNAARQSFSSVCGEPFNDQKGHKCDYKSDGFHCNGTVSTAAATGSTTPSGWCTGTASSNISTAKLLFANKCGQQWNDQLGHRCEWKTDGWHCSGVLSTASPPKAPTNIRLFRLHPQVVRIDWMRPSSASGIRGYDVYRNGVRIASTSLLYFVDRSASSLTSKYQIVAIGGNGVRSPSSSDSALSGRAKPGTVVQVNENVYAGNATRRVSGTVVVAPSGTVTSHATVTNAAGQVVGTISQEYVQGGVNTTFNANYGPDQTYFSTSSNAADLTPGKLANQVISAFPDRPASSSGGGDSQVTVPVTTTTPGTTWPDGMGP